MGEVFEKAIAALKSLPASDRERISWEILQRVESKNEWDRLVKSPKAREWLESGAKRALSEYKKITKRLGYSQLSVPLDNIMREDSYWNNFDELPDDIRQLAEDNYRLWQKSHDHPQLRFKQIYANPPIFSFRVGLRHRTVGVQTPEGRIAWFWVGSIDQFRELTAQC